MTMELLRHIASSRLPLAFHRAEDIEQVRDLCAQGLLIALPPAPPGNARHSASTQAAQVLALTQEGRATSGQPVVDARRADAVSALRHSPPRAGADPAGAHRCAIHAT